jgi:hypothetical protein
MPNTLILRLVTRLRPALLDARRFAAALLVAGSWWLAAAPALNAHEIPTSVSIIAFLKPDGTTLRFVARVPVEAMRDIQWPLRGPGYLELDRLGTYVTDGVKLWIVDNLKVYEDGRLLAAPVIRGTRISLPSDRGFESYETALANVAASPLPVTTDIARQQAMIDLVLEYPITSAESRFSIDAQFARLGVRTTSVLRFVPPAGKERLFTWTGDPGLVHLDPNFIQAAWQFVKLGFEHILDGIDHLLFVICLVIPFRRLRPLLVIVTAFTVAHSITMVASALGFAPTALWFPPVVEVLIALSIIYTAFENIVGARIERRWMIAFAFGLIHGFGFSFALRAQLQFAGSQLAASLTAFNVGVELGQVAVLLIAVPVLNWLLTRVVAEKVGAIILSALVAHTAWHWMLDRGATLGEYQFSMTSLEVIRLAIIGVAGVAIVWAGRPFVSRLLGTAPDPTPPGSRLSVPAAADSTPKP